MTAEQDHKRWGGNELQEEKEGKVKIKKGTP